LGGFLKSLANYSETIGIAFNFYRYYVAYKKGLVHNNLELENLNTITVDSVQRKKILDEHQSNFLPKYQERVEGLVQKCKENNIKPVLITQPQLIGDTIDPTTGINLGKVAYQDINGSTGWAILELYNEVIREVAAKKDVKLIDLARRMPKDSRYFYDFTHYTNEGAILIGKIISEEFINSTQYED
jgi:hypothetical protein